MSAISPKKILVLDDDKNIGRLLELILQTSHFSVIRSTTVGKALKRVRARQPDLIISDIMLKEESGYDLYWELQKSPVTNSIPFIFISAYPDQNISGREKIATEGKAKFSFLAKIFSPQTLLQAIEDVMVDPQIFRDPEMDSYGLPYFNHNSEN
ncbi:MAG: response regulator [Candidatus Auribacterota bacterium]|nr:response regulator [Candidatus Auribacterota bacterium]